VEAVEVGIGLVSDHVMTPGRRRRPTRQDGVATTHSLIATYFRSGFGLPLTTLNRNGPMNGRRWKWLVNGQSGIPSEVGESSMRWLAQPARTPSATISAMSGGVPARRSPR
jgi:hypothetical protein